MKEVFLGAYRAHFIRAHFIFCPFASWFVERLHQLFKHASSSSLILVPEGGRIWWQVFKQIFPIAIISQLIENAMNNLLFRSVPGY